MSEEAICDAWVVGTYLSDADLLLSSPRVSLFRNFEAENVVQSIAASVAVRGVLYGNANPVSRYSFKYKNFVSFGEYYTYRSRSFWQCRWHAIRRPKLWQVEQSVRLNKVDFSRSLIYVTVFLLFTDL